MFSDLVKIEISKCQLVTKVEVSLYQPLAAWSLDGTRCSYLTSGDVWLTNIEFKVKEWVKTFRGSD